MKKFYLLFFLPAFGHCQLSPVMPATLVALSDRHSLYLLDSARTASTLLVDTVDHYFERVTAVEMSIQLRQPLVPERSRAEWLSLFQDYLRRDAAPFTAEEVAFATEVIREVFETCQQVAPDLFPDTLGLAKIKGKPYGPSVYYTRQKIIAVPQDALQLRRRQDFLGTMYHELFHIYSRHRPDKRAQLYRRIGFESIGLERLRLPAALAQRLLHNPDGVDFAQKITLKDAAGKVVHAVPIIYANSPGYTPSKELFFAYLEFGLFEIILRADGHWQVLTQPDGYSSTLNLRQLPDFYRQIGDNTTYVIHPDEVLADNFSLLLLSKKNPAVLKNLSADGQRLLKDIEAILRR